MKKIFTNVTFFSIFAPAMFTNNAKCPDGGIGRRAGLKHQWGNTCAGSTPALGTE